MPTLALTGVTGRLGGRVANRLAARGLRPRLLVRNRSRAAGHPPRSLEELLARPSGR